MKLSKLRALAKKAQQIDLHESKEGVQWIQIQSATYPLYGLPCIESEEQLCAILDITEKEKENIHMNVGSTATYDTSDGGPDIDVEMGESDLSVGWCGYDLKILIGKDGTQYLIDKEMIAPVAGDDLNYAYRYSEQNIAVKHGVGIVALIKPIIAPEDMIKELRKCAMNIAIAGE